MGYDTDSRKPSRGGQVFPWLDVRQMSGVELMAVTEQARQLREMQNLPGWQRLLNEIERHKQAVSAKAMKAEQDELVNAKHQHDAQAYLPKAVEWRIAVGNAAGRELAERSRRKEALVAESPRTLVPSIEKAIELKRAHDDYAELIEHPQWPALMAIVGAQMCMLESNLCECRFDAASQRAVIEATDATLRKVDLALADGQRALGLLAQQRGLVG